MQKYRVQNASRIRVEAEADVADAEHRLYFRQFLMDALYGVQGLDARRPIFFLSGGDRERQRVEEQVHRTDTVLLCSQIEDAMRDRNFPVRGQRHALFIDGQCDDTRAIALRHRQHFRGTLLAVFEIDRIDDGFAGNALQRLFDYVGFGAINQYRRGHAGRDSLQDGGDVALLVFADDGAAQVEHVRAFVGQLFRQRQNVVVLLGLYQLAEVIDAR